MQSKQLILAAAIGSLMSFSAQSNAAGATAPAADTTTEKCFGIAKAGKNDCASNGHSCAGQSKKVADAKEWIKLPKGTCEKLAGGSLGAKS